MNEIIFDEIKSDFDVYSSLCPEKSKDDIIFMESAIVIESGIRDFFDYIILVDADIDVAIQRVLKRNNMSEDKLAKILKRQWKNLDKINECDFVIYNNPENYDSVEDQIKSILNTIKLNTKETTW